MTKTNLNQRKAKGSNKKNWGTKKENSEESQATLRALRIFFYDFIVYF